MLIDDVGAAERTDRSLQEARFAAVRAFTEGLLERLRSAQPPGAVSAGVLRFGTLGGVQAVQSSFGLASPCWR